MGVLFLMTLIKLDAQWCRKTATITKSYLDLKNPLIGRHTALQGFRKTRKTPTHYRNSRYVKNKASHRKNYLCLIEMF